MIIRVELLSKREEIQNEMSLLLERVSPSNGILIDILEFHPKSISHFDVLSSAYLLAQRLNVLELIVNYLRCPYGVQTKISSYVHEKWVNDWYAACIDYYNNPYDTWESWSTTILFPDRSRVGGVRLPANSIPPEDRFLGIWNSSLFLRDS